MTKQEILDKFNDIDFVYNDSSKHETLSRMLDELLKEHEAVKPTWRQGRPFCGACGLPIGVRCGKFCKECGRPIAWEGR